VRLPAAIRRLLRAVGAHRITTRASAGRVEVRCGGELLAASDRAVELAETGNPVRYYLPREDVRTDLLRPSATTSHCPFKGDARYFSAPGCQDAFWSYESPPEADARPIAGLLAPRPGALDIHFTATPSRRTPPPSGPAP
jgi:uncharacterized protein (DUF427 family)